MMGRECGDAAAAASDQHGGQLVTCQIASGRHRLSLVGEINVAWPKRKREI